MFSLTNILIAVGSLLAYFLYRQKKKYDFWKERNVPHVGFKRDLLFNGKKHRSLNLQDIYDEFSSHRYMGFYQGGKPHLLIRDLDLIRNVLVKDFAHFTDHVKMFNTDNDPLIRENIFSLDGERWKNVRTRLTPIFSSGKLRRMSSLMDECAKILDRHLDLTLAKSDEIEVRELMQKFSMDVMGICAFGLNCNAVIDEQSAFRRVAKKLFSPGSMSKFMLMMVAGCISPRIASWLKVKLIDQEVDDFFYSIMRDTLKNREETAMKRDDFVQLLMNLRAEEKKMIESGNYDSEPLFNDDICAANVFVFYAAGLDAFSATMSFCLYDLALHPDIQERLYKEIVQVQKANEGQVTYDVLQKMEYMDCVISETLRVHTSSGTLERVCTKKYQIPGSPLVIDEDMIVTIPGQSIHMDPKYFPNPEKYDPERFNEENKAKIIPGSYFPFSDGPRICIGMRFAIVEMKAALSRIIESYSVHPSPKTEIPIIPNPRSLSSSPATLYLRFQKR